MSREVRLVLCGDDGLAVGALPVFGVDSPWWPDVEPIATAVRDRFGIDVIVLRLADVEGGGAMRDGTVTYTAQALTALPEGVALEPAPAGLPLEDHPLRAAWARPGGVVATIAWADAALAARGTPRTGPVVQIKTWNLSSVLRLPVGDGLVWCKSVPPFMSHDGVAIGLVGPRHPGIVPPLLAVDPASRTVLLDDLGPNEQWDAPQERLIRMVRTWVSVQAGWASRGQELLDAGLVDRRARALASTIRALIERDDVRGRLGRDERVALDEIVADLPRRLEELRASGLPDSLVHGDFHPGNWIARGEDLVLIDWGEAGVGHPMLDACSLLEGVDDAAIREHVLVAWAEAWRVHVPRADPRLAAELLEPIAHLRGAATYQMFLDRIEPSEQRYHEIDVPDRLRRAIASARR